MSSGGGGGGGGTFVVRYAPYLESAHTVLLNHGSGDYPRYSVVGAMNQLFNNSPYSSYTSLNIDPAFLGSAKISAYDCLFDLFYKQMSGIDGYTLWTTIYNNTAYGPNIQQAVAAHAIMLDDDLNINIMPAFLAGMRDINAVMSSAFIDGRAIIYDSRIKSLNKFASDLQIRAMELSTQIWTKILDWHKVIVDTYQNILQVYYATHIEQDKANIGYSAQNSLWNINLFAYAKDILSALNGAAATSKPNQPDWMQGLGVGISALGLAGSMGLFSGLGAGAAGGIATGGGIMSTLGSGLAALI
jgi:hypothetical protein